jgi:hypothetical protein
MSRAAVARDVVVRSLLMALLVAFVLGLVAPRAHAAPPATGKPALLADFGSCLAGGGTGSIVLLIDQSGSLETTDPDGARMDGAAFLVERLAEFSGTSGYALDVRVAGFAAAYETPGDWTSLEEGNVAALEGQIDQLGADLRTHDTDYWIALESARQDLADHGGECSAVFWFSDGEYDIDPRESRQSRTEFGETKPYAPEIPLTDDAGAAEAVAAGEADICRPAGVADQLRSSGITVIGVGLMSEGADFSFLRSVTEGGGAEAAQRNGTEQCGEVASPEGAYFEVDDLDTLLMAFDALSSPGDSLSTSTVEICQGQECGAGEVPFVLDRALSSVRVLASSEVEGLDAYVVPPGASEAVRFPSSAGAEPIAQGGAEAAWLTPRTVEIELDAAAVDTWDGTWRVGFVDPASQSAGEQVAVNLHLSSPLVLGWQEAESTEIRQGTEIPDAALALVNRTDGSVVDVGDLGGSLSAEVTLTDADGDAHTLYSTQDKTALAVPVAITVPSEVALGEAKLVTSLQITTAPPTVDGETAAEGTALQPALLASTVSVLPPQNFPTVGTRVDFGLLEEETTAQATLDITGPGCVWLDPESARIVGAPAEAGTISVTTPAASEGECVRLAEGEQGALALELGTEEHANGAVQGTVAVQIAPEDDPSAAQSVTVPFDADLRRPLDVTTAGTAFAIALLLGIGIPLLALYVLTWLTARIPKGTLVSGSTRIALPEAGGRTEIALERNQLTLTSLPSSQRSVAVGGRMLRSRISPLPTEAPWVELDDPSPSVSGAVPGSRRGRARLPLGVRGNWIAIPDRHDPRSATLLVLLGSEDQSTLDTVLEDARQRVADRVRSLGLTAPAASTGGGPAAPSGSGGQGASAGPSTESPGWGASSPGGATSSGWGAAGGPASGGSWGSAGGPGTNGQAPSPGPGPEGRPPEGPAGGAPPGWGPSGPRSSPPPSPWGRS